MWLKPSQWLAATITMSRTNWARLGGMAAMLGGASWNIMVIGTALKPEDALREPGELTPLLFAALVLVAVGVLATQLRQGANSPWLGTITASMVALGVAITLIGRALVHWRIAPVTIFVAGLTTFIIGSTLFGISILRAGVLPRSAGWAAISGTLALFIFNFEDARIWIGLLFGASWMWLGYALQSGRAGALTQDTT